MQILIAEDDLTTGTMLEAVLTKWGYQVIRTTNGNDAWEAMQVDAPPSLLILDWMMPGMDGPALCKKLRGHRKDDALYIIFLTSKRDRHDVISGLDTGADDYITKPYDIDELRARIRVGQRMLALQAKLRKKEKLQGVLEMAGAVCHEINQPLQAVSGYAELLMMKVPEDDPNHRMAQQIKAGVDRIGQLTSKIMGISTYKAKAYMKDRCTIVDIDGASSTARCSTPERSHSE